MVKNHLGEERERSIGGPPADLSLLFVAGLLLAGVLAYKYMLGGPALLLAVLCFYFLKIQATHQKEWRETCYCPDCHFLFPARV